MRLAVGEIGLIRGAVVKIRMGTPAIVEVEIAADRGAGVRYAIVGPQVNLIVFDAAPPLDEHVVPPSSFAVQADRNAIVGEHAGERRVRELRGPDRS